MSPLWCVFWCCMVSNAAFDPPQIKFLMAPQACDSSWAQRGDPLRSQCGRDWGESRLHAMGCVLVAALIRCTWATWAPTAEWRYYCAQYTRRVSHQIKGFVFVCFVGILTTWSNFRTSTNLREKRHQKFKEVMESEALWAHIFSLWLWKFGFHWYSVFPYFNPLWTNKLYKLYTITGHFFQYSCSTAL